MVDERFVENCKLVEANGPIRALVRVVGLLLNRQVGDAWSQEFKAQPLQFLDISSRLTASQGKGKMYGTEYGRALE
jgi:hypothetical protein